MITFMDQGQSGKLGKIDKLATFACQKRISENPNERIQYWIACYFTCAVVSQRNKVSVRYGLSGVGLTVVYSTWYGCIIARYDCLTVKCPSVISWLFPSSPNVSVVIAIVAVVVAIWVPLVVICIYSVWSFYSRLQNGKYKEINILYLLFWQQLNP